MFILVLALWAAFGLTFPLGKLALGLASPMQLVAVRLLISGILLLGSSLIYSPDGSMARFAFSWRRDLWGFAKICLLQNYVAFMLEYWAAQYLSPVKVALIYELSPFFSVIFGTALFSEKFSWLKGVAIALGISGALLINNVNIFNLSWSGVGWPELGLMLGVAGATYAWFEVKRVVSKGYSLIFINGTTMLGAGALVAMQRIFLEPEVGLWQTSQPLLFFKYIGLMIIASNLIGYNLYGFLLRRYSATFISLTGVLCPIFAQFYSIWLVGSTLPTISEVTGLCVAGVGIAMFLYEEQLVRKSVMKQKDLVGLSRSCKA